MSKFDWMHAWLRTVSDSSLQYKLIARAITAINESFTPRACARGKAIGAVIVVVVVVDAKITRTI